MKPVLLTRVTTTPNSPVIVNTTWTSGSITLTVTNNAITSTSLVTFKTPSTASTNQSDMFKSAEIVCSSQTSGSITLTAIGTAPTMNIPIELTIDTAVIHNNIVVYNGTSGYKIQDSGISKSSLVTLVNNSDSIKSHILDSTIHITATEKTNWDKIFTDTQAHLLDSEAHVSITDRNNWNNKETSDGAQAKANIVQTNLNTHINDLTVHVTSVDKNRWSDTYTKNEIDNKFSGLETSTDWKEAVDTYNDLDKVYPSPEKGWTVNTLDTNITYRFNGTTWEAISANAIPKATESVDGLMTTTQVTKLDGIETGANKYTHPIYEYDENNNIKYKPAYRYKGVVYNFSELKRAFPDWINVTYEAVLSDELLATYGIEKIATSTPIYIYHLTDSYKEYWDNKAENVCATKAYDGLMSKEDKYKLTYIADNATNYVHPDYHQPSIIQQNANNRFVTDEQITYWNSKANNVLAQGGTLDGLMSMGDKTKLDAVEYNANYYIHPSFHEPSIIKQNEYNRFVTDAEKILWNSKAATTLSTTKADGLMSSSDKVKLDSVEALANHYVHPDYHQPTIIQQNANNRFVTDTQILSWTNKKDAGKVLCGTGVFNSTDGTFITHDIGHTTYSVGITLSEKPVNVGDIWVQKENNYILVFCSGTAKDITFDWIIIVE